MDKTKIIDICIQRCRKEAVSPVWVFFKQGESVLWREEKEGDRFTAAEEEKGISLRSISHTGDMIGSYTSDLGYNALILTADTLKNTMQGTPADRRDPIPVSGTSRPGPAIRKAADARHLAILQKNAEAIQSEEVKNCFRIMKKTLDRYKRYYDLQYGFSLQKGIHEITVADTSGFFESYTTSLFYLTLTIVGQRGERRISHWSTRASHSFDALDPQQIAASAAYETSVSLASNTALSGTYPVIYAPRPATEFLGLIGSSFASDGFFQGRSIFSGRLGAQIASRAVNIVDQGNLRGGLGTIPFDAEGTGSKTVVLIRNGRLENLLYDNFQANRRGTASTGNLYSPTYRELPRITPLNLTLMPGQQSLDTMIRGIEEGFYLLNTVDAEGTDLLEDRYRIIGSGLMIRHGKKAEPVSGVLLNGEISRMLHNIAAVGSHAYRSVLPGFPIAPAILIDGMRLS